MTTKTRTFTLLDTPKYVKMNQDHLLSFMHLSDYSPKDRQRYCLKTNRDVFAMVVEGWTEYGDDCIAPEDAIGEEMERSGALGVANAVEYFHGIGLSDREMNSAFGNPYILYVSVMARDGADLYRKCHKAWLNKMVAGWDAKGKKK